MSLTPRLGMFKAKVFLVLLSVCGVAAGQRLSQAAMIDLPGRPGFDHVVFANNLLVISHVGASTVDVFDPAKRRLVAQITNIAQPRGIAVDAKAQRIFVASGAGTIYVISTEDWQVKDSFTVSGTPDELALSSDSHLLFVARQVGTQVDAIDIALRRSAASADAGGLVGGIACGDDGTLFVTVQDQGTVLQLDRQMRIIARHKLQASQPTDIVYDPGKHSLYVAVRSAILELDAGTGNEIARVAAPRGVSGLWFDEGSHMLFAGGGGSILAIRAKAALRAQDELRVDVKGESLAYDAARALVYMPGGREGHSKLLIVRQPGTQPQPASEAAVQK